jgi:hypothetical protein
MLPGSSMATFVCAGAGEAASKPLDANSAQAAILANRRRFDVLLDDLAVERGDECCIGLSVV